MSHRWDMCSADKEGVVATAGGGSSGGSESK